MSSFDFRWTCCWYLSLRWHRYRFFQQKRLAPPQTWNMNKNRHWHCLWPHRLGQPPQLSHKITAEKFGKKTTVKCWYAMNEAPRTAATTADPVRRRKLRKLSPQTQTQSPWIAMRKHQVSYTFSHLYHVSNQTLLTNTMPVSHHRLKDCTYYLYTNNSRNYR